MFQYAAGLGLATLRQTVLKLDVGWFGHVDGREPHGRYSLNCFNICEQFATRDEVNHLLGRGGSREVRAYYKLRRLIGLGLINRQHYAQKPFFYPEFNDLPDNTYLEGNWQDEQFFVRASAMLRRHFSFRYPLPASAQSIAAKIVADDSSVMVHFRRGDYMTGQFNPYCRPLGLDYYHRALGRILARIPKPTLYIFSDDIEQVAQEFRPECEHLFVKPAADWQPFDELRLMSGCRHDIIANSTFSWWSAWLNENSDKVVVAPEPWFYGSEIDGSRIVPASWIRESTTHLATDHVDSQEQHTQSGVKVAH
jgi:hypothetical protein